MDPRITRAIAGDRDALGQLLFDRHDRLARLMDRPTDAVRGLLYRGRKKLPDGMGRSSLWLSKR